MTELEILRKVNDLNMNASVSHTGKTYWAVIVLYNWVIYQRDCDGNSVIYDTAKPKVEERV